MSSLTSVVDASTIREFSSYTGGVINGNPDGNGTGMYYDGSTISGIFKNGLCTGKITTGDRIETGTFKDGVLNGSGSITYTQSDQTKTIRGNFINGKLNGTGTISDGAKITKGRYADGKLVGKRKIIWQLDCY